MSLTIYDYSDREILFAIGDNLDESGSVTTHGLAAALGVGNEGAHGAGSRLAWMARYGVIEKIGASYKQGSVWTLTRLGRQLLDGNLSVKMAGELNQISDAQRITLMESLGGRAKRSETIRPLLRRSWTNAIGR